jgi:hypothetical protein
MTLYIKTPFELQPEDGFYEEAETCRLYDFLIIFYIVKVVLHCKFVYILLIIENTTGMPHLKVTVGTVLFTVTTRSEHYKDELRTKRHSNFTTHTASCNKTLSPNAQEIQLSGLLGGHIVAANWWALELRS